MIWAKIGRAILVICLSLSRRIPEVQAGITDYTCIVVTASKLMADGTLAAHWSVQPHIGESFTVDRQTGRIIGGPLDNTNMEGLLIDRGSKEMSFQSWAISEQRAHTVHLTIRSSFQRRSCHSWERPHSTILGSILARANESTRRSPFDSKTAAPTEGLGQHWPHRGRMVKLETALFSSSKQMDLKCLRLSLRTRPPCEGQAQPNPEAGGLSRDVTNRC